MTAVMTPEHPASPDATALIAELDAHLEPLQDDDLLQRLTRDRRVGSLNFRQSAGLD